MKMKTLGGTAAALAALALAAPATGQDRHGRGGDRGHGRHHHHRGDKVDAGGLVLGALLVGGIVALANGEKKRRERLVERYEAAYEAELPEEGDAVPLEGSAPVPDMPAPGAAEYDGLYDTEAATDRCASEAETVAQRYARLARVTSVTSQTWNGKSWVIKGRLELGDGYADPAKASHKFRCGLKAGQAPRITIDGVTEPA
jgi:hypothetical protein